MKSTVQTYDIRDSPEYRGVFEVEVMLQTLNEQDRIDEDMAAKIRDQFSKTKTSVNNLNMQMQN